MIREAWHGAIAMLGGIAVAIICRSLMVNGFPFYLPGSLLGMVVALVWFNRRSVGNKLLFAFIYIVVLAVLAALRWVVM